MYDSKRKKSRQDDKSYLVVHHSKDQRTSIIGTGDTSQAVVGHGKAQDSILMTQPDLDVLTSPSIPDLNRTVGGAGGDQGLSLVPLQLDDGALVFTGRPQLHRLDIPNVQTPVQGSCRGQVQVVRESNRLDCIRMILKRSQNLCSCLSNEQE